MEEYHYNLVLFKEIKRFWEYREQLGMFAVFTNLFGNVLIFVPFGFFMPMASKYRSLFSTLFYSFGLSLCVETFQLFSKVGAGGFVLVYNFEKDSILLIKITQNNNPIRKLIAHKALNQLKWIDTNIAEYEYNQQKEKVAKYCYEFNF